MVIKTMIGLVFIYKKIPFPLVLLFLTIYLGLQVLHIFIENYVWRKGTSPIHEFIFQLLYLVASFLLSGFLFFCFF